MFEDSLFSFAILYENFLNENNWVNENNWAIDALV